MDQINNGPVMKGIKAGVSLLAFAASHGKMQIANLTNKTTGEEFKSCAFTDNVGNVTFVKFSSNLGELTPQEIVARKNDLQVVTLDSDAQFPYVLCEKGANTWVDVDL